MVCAFQYLGTTGYTIPWRMTDVIGLTLDDGQVFKVTAPRDGSVMPPGVYMLFVTNNGVPSVAEWGTLI